MPFDDANFVNPLIAHTCENDVEDQSVDPEIGITEFGRWFLGAASRFVGNDAGSRESIENRQAADAF